MRQHLYLFYRKFFAWLTHVFTASGAILGVYAINAFYNQRYQLAFLLIGFSIVIDAVDGSLARFLEVKKYVPNFDGALLDNIVDYFNYVVVASFYLFVSDAVPYGWRGVATIVILMASAYQFCQADAKTGDHFFKGFPSYWNIAVFYMFFWQASPWVNLIIIFLLAILVFVPIKYVYPSRLEYLTKNKYLRTAMLTATIIWGIATFGLLWWFPETNWTLLILSVGYVIVYVIVSLYRTFYPLEN